MKFLKYFFVLLVYSSCSSSQEIAEQPISFLENTTVVYKNTSSNSDLTSLDIYTVPNSSTLKPVVIWIHGGAWAIGDKRNDMPKKSSFFTNLGYVFVSVNYRLSPFPEDLNNDSRIKHPAHIVDVADAIQWIQSNIEKYGGNSNKTVLIGHSAGAHLVALAGANQQLFIDRNISYGSIKGVISLDTQAYDIPKVIANSLQKDVYINAFTNNEALQKDASPYFQLDNYATTISNWLFVERGTNFRKQILSDFTTKVKSKNGKTQILDMNGYSHADVNDLIADTQNTILSQKIKEFLIGIFNE